MTVKCLKILLAATALGVGALAYSGPADARVRGGWHYGWHKGWYRGPVVASDYEVAPRRGRHRRCAATDYACVDEVVASDYDVAPRRGRHHRRCATSEYGCVDDVVVATDYDVAPRPACLDDCVVASDYVAPPAYDYGYCEPAYSYYAAPAVYAVPVVYTSGWSWPWGYGYGWPF